MRKLLFLSHLLRASASLREILFFFNLFIPFSQIDDGVVVIEGGRAVDVPLFTVSLCLTAVLFFYKSERMSPKPWPLIKSVYEKSLSIFRLRTDRARSPRTGEAHDFFILESPTWVNVIPLTEQGDVVMIRQWRHGIRQVTLEIPGGVVEPDDTPRDAARRELAEETGYAAHEMIPLGFVHPNPAIQDNRCYTFLARNAALQGGQALDDKEDIQIVKYPLSEIPRLIGEGTISHSLIIAAFWRYFMEYRDDAKK